MWKETSLSIVLVLLLLLFINPLEMFGMPTSSQMILLGIFVVSFMVFGAFVWQENPQDERESHHVFLASRVAFLCGSAVIACGIVVQMFSHDLDPWLPFSLGIMIVSKMTSLMYFRSKC